MSTRTRYDVTPNAGKWQLRRDQKVVSTHERQDDAVAAGRDAARSDQPSQLVVHGADGKIQDESTYQNDPFPPKG